MGSKVIIEVASTGAILIGLIFVGLELKQNTEAVKSQTNQGLLELANHANSQIASDRQLAELLLGVNKAFRPLDRLRHGLPHILLRSMVKRGLEKH